MTSFFTVYFVVLTLLPCLIADYEVCDVRPPCITTSKTNLTKGHRDYLTLEDASDPYEIFDRHERAELYCCFESSPYCPVIRWFKEGKELLTENGVREIKKDGRSLDIFSMREKDEGHYTCNATTPYGEQLSHVIKVKTELKCGKAPYLLPHPTGGRTKVEIGTNQTLQCSVFCYGSRLVDVEWRNANGTALREPKYHRKDDKPSKPNGPNVVSTLTVVNFTNSENVTCILKIPGTINSRHTFQLVPKECDGRPFISAISSGVDKIVVDEGSISSGVHKVVVEKGSDKTLKCLFSCLKKERFGEPMWRNKNGEPIVNNTSEYELSRSEIGKNIEGRPNYEIRLTIKNILRSETVSCHLSSVPNGTTTQSFNLVLSPDTGARFTKENFFKQKGQWILTALVVAMLLCVVFLLFWFRRRIKKWSIFYRPNTKPEIDAKYDAFVSFSEADGGPFVRSTLVPMLEDECGYSLSLHYREFVPGRAIVNNITEFIDDSRRILTIVTPKFLKSEWCTFEVDQGIRRAVGRPNTLVVVMLEEIPRSQLPKSLQYFVNKNTFLVWNDNQREKMRERIQRALGSPLNNKTEEGEKSAREGSLNGGCVQPNGSFSDNIV